MLEAILENIKQTGIGAGLFLVSYLSNMAFGVYLNTQILNQEFSSDKLKASAYKILAFGIGSVLLCVAITSIPIFCNDVGFPIPDEYAEIFSSISILAIFLYSSFKYVKESYTKMKEILNANT